MTDRPKDAPPHAASPGDVLARQGSSENGLTETEAAARLIQFGPNTLRATKQVSAWKILFDQFRGVVVLLLVGAALVAWLIGDPVEAVAVLAVLFINAALGFFTELKARGAMAALLSLEVAQAVVIRDGSTREIAAADLVPGDIIMIVAGQSVPADARLLTAAELRTNEAALTGESLPSSKFADSVLTEDAAIGDRINSVYMSTVAVSGSARAIVTATGMTTEVGHIGGLVGGIEQDRTPLEHRLDALGRRMVWVTLGIAALVIGIGAMRGEEIGLMIETGLALAIAAVPEGLATVSTIALAVGVARMAGRNVLVRRLPAVEALGSATVVCTDKTGTLTAGEMTVTALWTAGVEYAFTGVGYQPDGTIMREGAAVNAADVAPLSRALRIGALANRAALLHEKEDADREHDGTHARAGDGGWYVRGDPTDGALLVAARKGGIDVDGLRGEWPETGEIPFSSERMLMATAHRSASGPVLYVKGAPARVLDRCTHVLDDAGETKLDDAAREHILEYNRDMASRGLRVLALAQRTADRAVESMLQELTLVGLVGMSDPPAAGVQETIQLFRDAGIRTVMITGDQRLTADAIARELGIVREGDEVIEGRQLADLSPHAMADRLVRVSALSRVSPEDKLRIVEAFQLRGHIVAMLGDGVNDAPAIKRADIGVAMGIRGTDVAKEAAAVVLGDDRFRTIGAAIEEGRVIFDNIRKFVFYLFSCNVAEVVVILGASLIGMPQPLMPLQILWLNLVTDTFPALSLAMEPAEADIMKRPPADPQHAILSPPFMWRILRYALLIAVVTLGAFLWTLRIDGADAERAVTVAFMTLALAQIFHLGNARADRPVLGWRALTANRWALAAVALTVSLQLVAIYFAPLARVLHVVPLGAGDWLLVVPLALIPAIIGQAVAHRRGRSHKASARRVGVTDTTHSL